MMRNAAQRPSAATAAGTELRSGMPMFISLIAPEVEAGRPLDGAIC